MVWFSEDGVDLAQSVSASKVMTFAGLYCHEGQSYTAKDADELRHIGDEVVQRVLSLANRCRHYLCLVFIIVFGTFTLLGIGVISGGYEGYM